MSISQNGKFAGWIEEFVTALSKTASNDIRNENEEEELVVEADINIDDLDEIIWNEEKYRVMFDENGANIINEFGNTVTTLEGVKTLEEVNQRLSEKQIVVNSSIEIPNEFEEEINKAMKYIEDPEFNKIASEEQIIVEEPEIIINKKADIIEEPEIIIDKQDEEKEKIATVVKKFEIKASKILNKKVAEIEEQLSDSLDEKISAMIESKIDFMVEQVLAKVTEGLAELDIFNSQDIKDIEKQQYDKSANDTMEMINNENDADRTTPEGFFKNYDNDELEDEELYMEEDMEEPIMDDLDDIEENDEENEGLIIESPIEKDEPKIDLDKDLNRDLDIEDEKINEEIEEKSMIDNLNDDEDEMEQEASVEDPKKYLNKFRKHKNVKDLRSEKTAEDDGMNPANIEDYNPSEQSQPEEPQEPKDPQQEMQEQQDNIQNVQANMKDEEEIVGSDAEMFKTATCPFCANKLNTESKDGEFLNISCGSCNTKYKVNLNDERIYIR